MSSAIERLQELREAVRAAERRLGAVQGERSRGRRELALAKGRLLEHLEAVAAGETDPDGDLEGRLTDALRAAQGALSARPVLARTGTAGEVAGEPGLPKVVDLELVDELAEARVRGAQRAVDTAREEVAHFAAENLPQLAAERWPESQRVGAEALAALGTARAADAAWAREAGWWSSVLELAGEPGLAEEVPENPFGGLRRVPVRGPLAPAPASLIPDPEGDPDADPSY